MKSKKNPKNSPTKKQPNYKFDWKKLLNLKSIGTILIFFSWISQNYYLSNYEAQLKEFSKSSNFRSNELALSAIWWNLFITEKNKENRDPHVVVMAALNSIKYAANTLYNDKVTVSSFEFEEKAAKKEKEETIKTMYNLMSETWDMSDSLKNLKSNYPPDSMITIKFKSIKHLADNIYAQEGEGLEKYIEHAESYMGDLEKKGESYLIKFDIKYSILVEQERNTKKLFLSLYVFGAFIIGIGYIFTPVKH